MAEKKKVLFVTQELDPYTEMSDMSIIVRKMAEYAQSKGMEVRVLMPRFGLINERRHRLHEVVRLSGMNIIVDDDDFPLIIKVASLPGARMQVYFLDNEDFFKRKNAFTDENDQPFEDNPDRMVFFSKGVIETVRKFGWAPNIVHCHGWMTALMPIFIREGYKTEHLFHQSKIVYSIFDADFDKYFNKNFEKACINQMTLNDLAPYYDGDQVSLHKGACYFADAVVKGEEHLSEATNALIDGAGKPVLEYQGIDAFPQATIEFYKMLLEQEEAVEN